MRIGLDDVLVVVDLQNDFYPGGALAIAEADQILAPLHRIAPLFAHIVLTQDWHPAGHSSFASSHPDRRPLETIAMPYGPQTLWPDHCVQATAGAELHPGLDLSRAELILRKGTHPAVDSYSAFFENDHRTPTGLAGYMNERRYRRAFFAGLAYDYCVGYSALDAQEMGLEAFVFRDLCRAIDQNGSVEAIEARFAEASVVVLNSASVDPGQC